MQRTHPEEFVNFKSEDPMIEFLPGIKGKMSDLMVSKAEEEDRYKVT